MEKIFNRISSIVLLAIIAGSYIMWIVGIDTKITSFLYVNSMYFLLIAIAIVLLLNIKTFSKSDWVSLGFAISIFIFYTFTSSIRHSNRFINAEIPIAILLILCFKKCKFDKVSRNILIGITGITLSLTMFRLYIELPKLIPVDLIGRPGNKLEFIWINTNTIGASILLSTMMLSILIKAAKNNYVKWLVIPIYISGILGTWVCESKTSFAILVLFILMDNIIPKCFLQKYKWWILIFILLFVIAPVTIYYFSQFETKGLFTGREYIWREFFDKWLSNKQHILIGMEQFQASWKPLGTHNSFLYVLSYFGVIGYILFFGYLTYVLISSCFLKTSYSKMQVSLLLAFLAMWIYSFMEDVMLAYHWMPIIYSFLGIFLSESNNVSEKDSKCNL